MVLKVHPRYIVLERQENMFHDEFCYKVAEMSSNGDFYLAGGFPRVNHLLKDLHIRKPIILVNGMGNITRYGEESTETFDSSKLNRRFRGLVIPFLFDFQTFVRDMNSNFFEKSKQKYNTCWSSEFRPSSLEEGISSQVNHRDGIERSFYAISPSNINLQQIISRVKLPEDLLVEN